MSARERRSSTKASGSLRARIPAFHSWITRNIRPPPLFLCQDGNTCVWERPQSEQREAQAIFPRIPSPEKAINSAAACMSLRQHFDRVSACWNEYIHVVCPDAILCFNLSQAIWIILRNWLWRNWSYIASSLFFCYFAASWIKIFIDLKWSRNLFSQL